MTAPLWVLCTRVALTPLAIVFLFVAYAFFKAKDALIGWYNMNNCSLIYLDGYRRTERPLTMKALFLAALVVGGFVGFVIGATWQWEQAPQCRTTVFSSQEMRSL